MHGGVFIDLHKLQLLHRPHYYRIPRLKDQKAFSRDTIHFRKDSMWRRSVVNRCMNYDIVEMIVGKGQAFRIFKLPLKWGEVIWLYTCIQVANGDVYAPDE